MSSCHLPCVLNYNAVCCASPTCQVLWSYGTRGNDDYFVYHGFALPQNPDEDVVLFSDVQQLLGWALQRLPQLQPLAGAGWDEQQLAAVAGKGWCMWCGCVRSSVGAWMSSSWQLQQVRGCLS
jgi:hypothetical protein